MQLGDFFKVDNVITLTKKSYKFHYTFCDCDVLIRADPNTWQSQLTDKNTRIDSGSVNIA